MAITDDVAASSGAAQKARRTWKHLPEEYPVEIAPFAMWPPKLFASIAYVAKTWLLPNGVRFQTLAVALIVWNWFTPSYDRVVTFQVDWMAEILLRNLVVFLAAAGGLHLWLYTFRMQGDATSFDARPMVKNNKAFLFNSQVWENMFWSLSIGVPVGTLYECVMHWAFANGHIVMIDWMDNPVWFAALFVLLPLATGTHFYILHRFEHIEPFFKWIHSIHHKNVNVGPWSGHSAHPLETAGIFSDIFLLVLVPCHPLHALYVLMAHYISGPAAHCGYEKIKILGITVLNSGDFFHHLHHRFYDCNYGTQELPFDPQFKSFHDGSPENDKLIAARRRELRSKATARSKS